MLQKTKRLKDPDIDAVNEIYKTARAHADIEIEQLKQRERMVAQCHEMAGQIRAANMFKEFTDVSSLVWLKQVKDSQIYKNLPGFGTWEKFCNYIGISQQHADEKIKNLSILGEQFLRTVSDLSVGYRELKKLRQLTSEGDVTIEAEFAVIGEEKIPLDKNHAEDLQAAIESILEKKNRELSDQAATIRAKDKVLKDKETLLNRQAKEIAKLEGHAAEVGYTPAEEKLMQKMDNARTIIDGFMMDFDPERRPLPEDASPRMRAKLMHTLDYFRRVILGAFDTAADFYGIPEIDDDWVPPHLRKREDVPDTANGEE